MKSNTRRVLVFAREPRPGKVKTRLIPALGAAGAAALYERLLAETLGAVAGLKHGNAELWYESDDAEPLKCRKLAAKFGAVLHQQHGVDLGERMKKACRKAAPSARDPLVIIGSDCPGYTADYLSQAFDALRGVDAVLGPALDGGYVLIGLTRTDPRLFDEMPWGTSKVLGLTRSRLRVLGWRWRELPPLRDIDRPSDLAHFPLLQAGGASTLRGIES